VLAHSSREGSSAQPRQPQEPPARSKSVALGTMGKRQRYQRHGLLGSAWNNMPRINPAGPSSGSGVVKRQVLRSPGSGCKPIHQGRSEGFEKTPETHRARVLVVEAVGSRSRSVRIEVELRGTSQGNPQRGDLVRGKSLNPLTRTTVAHL